MEPEDCPQCKEVFMASPALQVEIRHQARKHGKTAALQLLREKLEGEHEQHT